MYKPLEFKAGNYSYLPSVFQYSAGVFASPGYRLEQVRFKQAVPLHDGFIAVEKHLRAIGRPATAFAHCELRSPRPFDDQGFIAFITELLGCKMPSIQLQEQTFVQSTMAPKKYLCWPTPIQFQVR